MAGSGNIVAYLSIQTLGQFLQKLVLMIFQVVIAASAVTRYEAIGVLEPKCGYLVGSSDLDSTSCPNFWHTPVDVLAIVVLMFGFLLCFVIFLLVPFRRFMASPAARWATGGLFRRLRRPMLRPSKLPEALKLHLWAWPISSLMTTMGVWTESLMEIEQCSGRLEWLDPMPREEEKTQDGAEEAPGASFDVVSLRAMAESSTWLYAFAWLPIPIAGPVMFTATLYLNRHRVFTIGSVDYLAKNSSKDLGGFGLDSLVSRDEHHLRNHLQEAPLAVQVLKWIGSFLMFLFMLIIQLVPGDTLMDRAATISLFMGLGLAGRLSNGFVCLLSGRSCLVAISPSDNVMLLLQRSREKLDVDISRLYAGAKALPLGHRLVDLGIKNGAVLTGAVVNVQVISSLEALWHGDAWPLTCCSEAQDGAFLAAQRDGKAVVWGGLACSDKFYQELTDLCDVKATVGAFAALRPNGSVLCWGKAQFGGDKSEVKDQLQADVCALYANSKSFAALKHDGSVVTWGGARYANFGGDSSKVQEQLVGVQRICAAETAFAALKADGSVVTWGDSCQGGDSSRVTEQLRGVVALHSTRRAFAALKDTGEVVTWGTATEGGGSFMVQDQLHSVVEVSATTYAFSALRSDGSVISWGQTAMSPCTTGVLKVIGNDCAFAAVLGDGSVVTWSDSNGGKGGGDSLAAQRELRDIVEIHPFEQCFVAMRRDKSAIFWGRDQEPQVFRDVTKVGVTKRGLAALKMDGSVEGIDFPARGGISFTSVESQLQEGVTELHMNANAFAAVKHDGSILTWGSQKHGGDSRSVQGLLAEGAIAVFCCTADLVEQWTRFQAAQNLISFCEDLFAAGHEPLKPSEGIDPLEGLTPLDRHRVKQAWREMEQLPWLQEGRLPVAVYSWLSSRGIQCNAGELALAMLQRQRDHERHLEVHVERNPEVPPSVLLSVKVLLLRAAVHNDLCILEAKKAARVRAHAEAYEAAKNRAKSFQTWCQRKASVRAAAAANALLMAFEASELSQVRKKKPLWMRFSFSTSTEAAVSVLPSAFMRRILEAQEARYGITVWGYVHLEWPVDKDAIFNPQDAVVGSLRSGFCQRNFCPREQ
eukprot:symbB.v1.2.004693.t1/scaffold269.1/size246462/3